MKLVLKLWRWVGSLGRRRAIKQEIDEELRFHLEHRTSENIAVGMSPDEAARAARKRFGNVQSVREDCRDIRGASFGEAMGRDIRFAFRQLCKNPGFTAVAVLTLAVCIGANLSVFAVVDAILFRSLSLRAADRLVVIHNAYPSSGVERGLATITDYFERRRNIEAFESLSMLREENFIVGQADTTQKAHGAEITPEFFQTLGIPLARGETFTDAELDYGHDMVAIITEQFWRDYFGADPNVIGRTLLIDRLPNRVIGVLPAGFRYLSTKAQIYRPLSHFRETRDSVSRYAPGTHTPEGRDPVGRYTARARWHDGQMIARLRADRSAAQAQAELDVVNSRRLALDPLGETFKSAGYHPWIESLRSAHVYSVKRVVLSVHVGALFLLLLGATNLSGLLLIRGSARAKEMAVRLALGAGRAQLARGVLVETTTLSLVGGAFGVVLAYVGIRLALWLGADALPLGADIAFDFRVAAVATFISIALGAAIGLPVLWLNPRGESSSLLQTESRGATGTRGFQRLRHGLMVTQIAVGCVLLYGAGVLGLSLKRTLEKSPGFEPDPVLSGDLMLPWMNYEENSKRVAFVYRLLERIRVLPGVSHAAVSSALPFTSGGSAPRGILPEGFVPSSTDNLRTHYVSTVTGDYWRAMGIPLLKGRVIDDTDIRVNAPRIAVIDATVARLYWPKGDAIGRRFCTDVSVFNPDFTYTVVGIVGNVKQQNLAESSKLGAVYLPYTDFPNFQVIIRTSASAGVMGSALRNIVKQLDPGLPTPELKSMRMRIDESLVTRRSPAILAAVFAGVALLLAGIGTYGVLAYAVAQRRREVGVRMALGATQRQIGRQFLTIGLKVLGLGLSLGSVGAWGAGRAMRSLLVEVPPFHVVIGVATVLVMSLVTLLAALLPTRRAIHIDPMEALRHE